MNNYNSIVALLGGFSIYTSIVTAEWTQGYSLGIGITLDTALQQPTTAAAAATPGALATLAPATSARVLSHSSITSSSASPFGTLQSTPLYDTLSTSLSLPPSYSTSQTSSSNTKSPTVAVSSSTSTHATTTSYLFPTQTIEIGRWNLTFQPNAAKVPPGVVLEFQVARADTVLLQRQPDEKCKANDEQELQFRPSPAGSGEVARYTVFDTKPRAFSCVPVSADSCTVSQATFRLNFDEGSAGSGSASRPASFGSPTASTGLVYASSPAVSSSTAPLNTASSTTFSTATSSIHPPITPAKSSSSSTRPPVFWVLTVFVTIFAYTIGCNGSPLSVSVDSSIILDDPKSTPAVHEVTFEPGGAFQPHFVSASLGDTVRFQIGRGKYAVTQSSLRSLCAAVGTFDSGFFSSAVTTHNASVDVLVVTTAPQWFFSRSPQPQNQCSYDKTFAINPGNQFKEWLALTENNGPSTGSSVSEVTTAASLSATGIVSPSYSFRPLTTLATSAVASTPPLSTSLMHPITSISAGPIQLTSTTTITSTMTG